jgi:hypothetical protein
LHSAVVAALIFLLLVVYEAASGQLGASIPVAAASATAYVIIFVASLAFAHAICGILIGGRIQNGRIGLGSTFLMATAFAAFVLLALKMVVILLFLTGNGGLLPGFAGLGAAMMCIAWASWFMVYRYDLKARPPEHDPWAEIARRR